MNDVETRSPKMPPRWFVHTFWRMHRRLYRFSRGRFLWTTASKRGWGALHLTTVGRRSGKERSVIVGYLADGSNLVTLAMNGWDEGHPAWWLNLEAHSDAVVRLAHERPRPVRARAAAGEEREQLWARWASVDVDLDAYAASRSTETPVVVLEPRSTVVGDGAGNANGIRPQGSVSEQGAKEMDQDRRTARIVGILFIVATVASILGSVALGSVLDGSDYLTTAAAQDGQVITAALLFLIAATSAFATAFLLFPILRRHAEGLAAGYVGLRAFENVFYVASVVGILAMLRVSQSDTAGSADVSQLALLGAAMMALRDWSTMIGTLIFAGLGAVTLNYVLYRSRLVPGWLSLWGFVGGVLLFLYGVLGILGVDTGLGSPWMLLAMPIAVEEMVFAGWLLTKGFTSREVHEGRARDLRVNAMT
jgi:deazaflavin-dependent oxidoreductase (nitroreductase family)